MAVSFSPKVLLRKLLARLTDRFPTSHELFKAHEGTRFVVGQALARDIRRDANAISFNQAECKIFSQFGEDGIIQYLLAHLSIAPDEERFVEFGVENYHESNTRFLLMHDNWSGVVLDGSEQNIESIKRDDIAWRYDVTPVRAFISKANINQLLETHGMIGDIGLLSIDIDGNDYWVWKEISVARPIIVIAEYNSLFGPSDAVTIPYDPSFQRTKAHYSNLYWGCSLRALCHLAQEKGYVLVGGNRNGNNAFFVRKDRLGALPEVLCEEAYRQSRFHESRDREGALSYLPFSEAKSLIAHLPLVTV